PRFFEGPMSLQTLLNLQRDQPADRAAHVRIEATSAVRTDRNAHVRRVRVSEVEHVERQTQALGPPTGEGSAKVVDDVQIHRRVGIHVLSRSRLGVLITVDEIDEQLAIEGAPGPTEVAPQA